MTECQIAEMQSANAVQAVPRGSCSVGQARVGLRGGCSQRSLCGSSGAQEGHLPSVLISQVSWCCSGGNGHFPWVRKSDWGVILSEGCASSAAAGGNSCRSDTPASECRGVTPACCPSPLLGPCCRPTCPLLCSLTLLGCSCLCLQSRGWAEGVLWHRARGLALSWEQERYGVGEVTSLRWSPCPSCRSSRAQAVLLCLSRAGAGS